MEKRYIVINTHFTFGGSWEFSDLTKAREMCDSERLNVGGDVHIYEMEPIGGDWLYSETSPIVPHTTGQR